MNKKLPKYVKFISFYIDYLLWRQDRAFKKMCKEGNKSLRSEIKEIKERLNNKRRWARKSTI